MSSIPAPWNPFSSNRDVAEARMRSRRCPRGVAVRAMVNERKRLAGRGQTQSPVTLATLGYRIEFFPHLPQQKERSMEQTIRRLTALVPALALVAGTAAVAAVARPTTPVGDHTSQVCVISGEISYCLPRDT